MPNRILRPWTDSEAVNSLSAQAEVFFVRLIMCADDYGRFHGNPLLLKSYLYPLKENVRVTDISRWIAECVKAGMITVYEHAGKRYIEIKKFGQRARTPSRFPPSDDGNLSASCAQMTADCGQMSADCGQMTALGEGEGEDVCECESEGGGDTPPAHAHTCGKYPETVEDVIRIAESPQVGMKCSQEQATLYLATRQARDWIDGARAKVLVGGVPADLKKWLLRDQQKDAGNPRRKGITSTDGRVKL